MDTLRRIKELLDKRGWTTYRLAQEAELPTSTLSNLFNRYNEPSISTLALICKGFGISMSEFFSEEGVSIVLTEQQKDLLDSWSRLDENQKHLLLEFFKTL